jgi:hypothetical protein
VLAVGILVGGVFALVGVLSVLEAFGTWISPVVNRRTEIPSSADAWRPHRPVWAIVVVIGLAITVLLGSVVLSLVSR